MCMCAQRERIDFFLKSYQKKKYIDLLERDLVNEGRGNTSSPLDLPLFLKLLKKNYNKNCLNNPNLPVYLKDSKW